MIGNHSNTNNTRFTLAQAKPGKTYRIVGIAGQGARENLLRLGLAGGSLVKCSIAISRGPVVVRHGRSDIAIGHGLARQIVVEQFSAQLPGLHGLLRGGVVRGHSNTC